MYFDQRTGASHAVHWSKLFFLTLKQGFPFFFRCKCKHILLLTFLGKIKKNHIFPEVDQLLGVNQRLRVTPYCDYQLYSY